MDDGEGLRRIRTRFRRRARILQIGLVGPPAVIATLFLILSVRYGPGPVNPGVVGALVLVGIFVGVAWGYGRATSKVQTFLRGVEPRVRASDVFGLLSTRDFVLACDNDLVLEARSGEIRFLMFFSPGMNPMRPPPKELWKWTVDSRWMRGMDLVDPGRFSEVMKALHDVGTRLGAARTAFSVLERSPEKPPDPSWSAYVAAISFLGIEWRVHAPSILQELDEIERQTRNLVVGFVAARPNGQGPGLTAS